MANIADVELDIRLHELAEGLGLSVYEFVSGGYVNLETYQLDLANINARLDAIDVLNGSDGVETVVERLETLRNIFETTEGDLITTVIADIAANKSAIESEKAAREAGNAANAAIGSRVTVLETSATTLDNKIAAEKVAREAADLVLDNKIQVATTDLTGVKARLDVIEGSESVEGSIKKAVKVEKDRALAVSGDLSNLSTEFTGATRENLVAAINSLKASLGGGISSSISDLSGRVYALESSVNDVVDGQGAITRGLRTEVLDLRSEIDVEKYLRDDAVATGVAEAKAYADDKFLGVTQIQNLDICGAVNKFRAKLFLAPKVCDGSNGGTTPVDGGSQGGGL